MNDNTADAAKVELLRATCLQLAKQVEACLTHIVDLNARVERLETQLPAWATPKLLLPSGISYGLSALHRGPGPI